MFLPLAFAILQNGFKTFAFTLWGGEPIFEDMHAHSCNLRSLSQVGSRILNNSCGMCLRMSVSVRWHLPRAPSPSLHPSPLSPLSSRPSLSRWRLSYLPSLPSLPQLPVAERKVPRSRRGRNSRTIRISSSQIGRAHV